MIGGSLQSTVELGFVHDGARDQTVMRHRRAGGLCHVGKPYWSSGVLGLHLVNPTAGIFAGDDLHLSVDVGEGARVALNSPSATRFHTMDSGAARIVHEFRVGAGGWLDYQPEWTIPQGGADVDQVTRIHLAAGASMMFLDLIAPGRVAHGEQYAYRRYATTFEINRGDETIVRERMELDANHGGWPLVVPGWDVCYYAAIWFIGDVVDGDLAHRVIEDLELLSDSGSLRCGATWPADEMVVFRLLSNRSLLIKKALTEVRSQMISVFPLLKKNFRKL